MKHSLKKKVVSMVMILALVITSITMPENSNRAQGATTYTDYHPVFLLTNVYGKNGVDSSAGFGESTNKNLKSPLNKAHGSINGLAIQKGDDCRLTYCLGYGLHLSHTTIVDEQEGVHTSDTLGTTWKSLANWQKKYIQNAMMFGLSDQYVPHDQKNIQSLIKNNKSLYAVTQVMIWAVCHASDEDKMKQSSYRNVVRNRFLENAEHSKFDSLWTAMNQCFEGTIPSFAYESQGQADKSIKRLVGKNNETNSSIALTDTTGLLSHGKNNKYSYTEIVGVQALNGTPKSDLTVKRNENTLTITLGKGKLIGDGDSFLIKLKTYYGKYSDLKGSASTETVTATTLQHKEKKTQALGISNAGYKVKESFLRIQAFKEIAPSSITIHKEATDGNVANWRFLIKRDATASQKEGYIKDWNNRDAANKAPTLDLSYSGGTVNFTQIGYTDVNGNCIFSNLPKGIYKVYEEGYGYANITQKVDGLFEDGYTYDAKYQSALLSLYDKTVTSGYLGEYHWKDETTGATGLTYDSYNISDDAVLTSVYRMTGQNVNIDLKATETENPMLMDGKKYTSKLYNQGYFTLIVDEGENATATVTNTRTPKSLSIQKEYQTDPTIGEEYSQASKELEELTIKTTLNPSSAWFGCPSELYATFGFNGFFQDQSVAPFSQMITNTEGMASTGTFYAMTNLTSEGNKYPFSMDAGGDGGSSLPLFTTASGEITETKVSKGSERLSISNNGQIADFASIPTEGMTYTVTNGSDNQPFEIVKRDKETNEVVKKEGFTFCIYNAYTGEKVKDPKTGKTDFVTNEEGIATFGDIDKNKLSYGTYVIKETKAPSPYILNEDCYYFTIAPREDEQTTFDIQNTTEVSERIKDIVNNAPITDWTDGTTPSAPTDNESADVDNTDSNSQNQTETDANEDFVPAWDESLVGTDETYGYEDKASEIESTVKKFLETLGKDPTTNIYPATYENVATGTGKDRFVLSFVNGRQFGKLELDKTTEAITAGSITTKVTKWGTDYDIEYEQTEYANIEYEVRADEDIVSAYDKNKVLYPKGELVATIKTDRNGHAELDSLHVGKYTVTEKKTESNKGKVVSGKSYSFAVEYEGTNSSTQLSFFNERQKCKISVYKQMELNDLVPNQPDAYKKVVFGLFAREDITDGSGKVFVPKNSLLDVTHVKKENDYYIGTFEEDVPYGKYYVKELQTDDFYELNTKEYDVVFEWKDYTTPVQEIRVNMDEGGFILNTVKTIGKMDGSVTFGKPKEVIKTNSKSGTTEDDMIVKTGDTFNYALWLFVLLSSGSMLALLWYYRKKYLLKTQNVHSCAHSKKHLKSLKPFFSFLLLFALVAEIVSVPVNAKTVSGTAVTAVPAVKTVGNETGLTKTTTYKTTEDDYKNGIIEDDTFPVSVAENGVTYNRTNVTYTVSGKQPQYKTQPVTYAKHVNGLESKNYKAPKSVYATDPEDNKKVKVQLDKVTYKSRTETREQNVNSQVDYGYQTTTPNVPKEKTVTVKNKTTGKDEKTVMKLAEVISTKEEWKDDFIVPMTIHGYGSQYYTLNGFVIKASQLEEDVFLDVKEQEAKLLDYLGLDADSYKILSVKWNGSTFSEKDEAGKEIVSRKATVTASRKVKQYKAVYTTVLHTPVTVYDATATYTGKRKIKKGTEYTVKATAYYTAVPATEKVKEAKKTPEKKSLSVGQIVGIAVASVLIIALIVVILYLLGKKKTRNTDEIKNDVHSCAHHNKRKEK